MTKKRIQEKTIKCPDCSDTIYRCRRRWYERLYAKEVYRCTACDRRRYVSRFSKQQVRSA